MLQLHFVIIVITKGIVTVYGCESLWLIKSLKSNKTKKCTLLIYCDYCCLLLRGEKLLQKDLAIYAEGKAFTKKTLLSMLNLTFLHHKGERCSHKITCYISVIRDTQQPWSFVQDLRHDEIRGWWWWWRCSHKITCYRSVTLNPVRTFQQVQLRHHHGIRGLTKKQTGPTCTLDEHSKLSGIKSSMLSLAYSNSVYVIAEPTSPFACNYNPC